MSTATYPRPALIRSLEPESKRNLDTLSREGDFIHARVLATIEPCSECHEVAKFELQRTGVEKRFYCGACANLEWAKWMVGV